MKSTYIVHFMQGDKFTLPLVKQLNKIFDSTQHHFLILGENDVISPSDAAVSIIRSPFKIHFFMNLIKVAKQFWKADRIVMHGIPALHYFLFFPFALNKLVWVIYGGTDLYLYSGRTLNKKTIWLNRIRKYVLRGVKIHLTHIEGDSKLANKFYGSNAKFLYHPVYLSNVVDNIFAEQYGETKKTSKLNILIGHSTDPSNHHQEIFEWLRDKEDVQIFCPLSYGPYEDYKLKVKQIGFEMFGDRFIPIENFMSLDQYKAFLNTIDIAIFNHKRQEAMGVTLSLLSLGKEVYVNNSTTSFKSFMDRGFQVFDNALVANEFDKLGTRDVGKNADLLNHYYSREVWEKQWRTLYNMNSFEQFT